MNFRGLSYQTTNKGNCESLSRNVKELNARVWTALKTKLVTVLIGYLVAVKAKHR